MTKLSARPSLYCQWWWKTCSLWSKQAAHWLCSLLSAWITRPLTNHSLLLSFKCTLWPMSASPFKHVDHNSAGHTKRTRVSLKPPTFLSVCVETFYMPKALTLDHLCLGVRNRTSGLKEVPRGNKVSVKKAKELLCSPLLAKESEPYSQITLHWTLSHISFPFWMLRPSGEQEKCHTILESTLAEIFSLKL